MLRHDDDSVRSLFSFSSSMAFPYRKKVTSDYLLVKQTIFLFAYSQRQTLIMYAHEKIIINKCKVEKKNSFVGSSFAPSFCKWNEHKAKRKLFHFNSGKSIKTKKKKLFHE